MTVVIGDSRWMEFGGAPGPGGSCYADRIIVSSIVNRDAA